MGDGSGGGESGSKLDIPTIKKWALTPHAVERMAEREVSIEEIEEILKNPDEVVKQGPKFIFAKNIKGRSDNMIATVIVEKKEHGLWLIITIMMNFQKY